MPDFQIAYVAPESVTTYQDLVAIQDQATIGRSLLSILSTFWSENMAQFQALSSLTGAMTGLLGDEFSRVLKMVQSSSILSIPGYPKAPYQLFTFSEADAVAVLDETTGDVQHIAFPCKNIQGLEYLTDTLFSPKVVLVEGEHFEIVDDEVRFYVDLFNDTVITSEVYIYGSSERVILLWGGNVYYTEYGIYNRFGRFSYTRNADSEAYRVITIALQFFFTRAKTVSNIESVLNILFNMPFSRTEGEVVLSITLLDPQGNPAPDGVNFDANAWADSPEEMRVLYYHKIVTTHNVYYAPLYADLLVSVGQTLVDYQLLCTAHVAEDYISNPDWYADSRFPFGIVKGFDDYTRLTIPTEYLPYMPVRYNGDNTYNGTRMHVGKFIEFEGINPFRDMRSKAPNVPGTDLEHDLYAIMDSVLKYNVFHMRVNLNHENLQHYTQSIQNVLSLLQGGIPVHLYPVIETAFRSTLIDYLELLNADESELRVFLDLDPDLRTICSNKSHDGTVQYSNPYVFTYNGQFMHDGLIKYYPLDGTAVLYNCETERFFAQLAMLEEDQVKLFGFYPENTFEYPPVWVFYDGAQSHNNKILYGPNPISRDMLRMTLTSDMESAFSMNDDRLELSFRTAS